MARRLFSVSRQEYYSQRPNVLREIHEADRPLRFLGEFLHLCVHEGGVEGLNIGIDILAEVPRVVTKYIGLFLKRDTPNWEQIPKTSRPTDDVWYILARALAQSSFEPRWLKIAYLRLGLLGTWSMRDASLRALADIGGSEARKIVESHQEQEQDKFVQETIKEILVDWED